MNGNAGKPVAEDTVVENVDSQGKALPLGKVTYKNVWENIDIAYTGGSGIVESTYYLNNTKEKDANVGDIRLKYNRAVEVNAQGELVISYETGIMTESSPKAWQIIDGARKAVEVKFIQYSQTEVGFTLGEYVSGVPVIIDPVLTWNTFLGGTGDEYGLSLIHI